MAEASLTIEGVSYVIDSCFTQVSTFNPISGSESEQITKISQS